MSRKLSSMSGGKANTTDTKRSSSSPVEIAPLVGGSDMLDGFDADGKSILINKGNWDWAGGCFMKTQGNCVMGPYSVKENKKNRTILINGYGKPVNAEMFCSLTSFTLETLKGCWTPGQATSVCRLCWALVEKAKKLYESVWPFVRPRNGDLEKKHRATSQVHDLKHYLQYTVH